MKGIKVRMEKAYINLTIASIEKETKSLEDRLHKLQEKKKKAIRCTLVRCKKCRRKSSIRSWIFIQNQFYVRPYSCTRGDDWANTETRCCHIMCPRCNEKNYLYDHPQTNAIIALVRSAGFSKEDVFHEVRTEQSN